MEDSGVKRPLVLDSNMSTRVVSSSCWQPAEGVIHSAPSG